MKIKGSLNNLNIRSVLSLSSNPVKTISAGSKIIEITTPSTHGGIPGQYVTLSNIKSSIDGIAASELNARHVISSVPSVNTFTITVLSCFTGDFQEEDLILLQLLKINFY